MKAFAFALVLALVLPVAARAQSTQAGVVTRLEGTVTAVRASLPQPVALKFKDGVFVNDRIVTGDQSVVRMLLGGKAAVTVRERSSLTITEVPGRSTVNLQSGKIALAVARERMRAGDSIEIRTPNAVAGIRGTVVIADYKRTTEQPEGLINKDLLRAEGDVSGDLRHSILSRRGRAVRGGRRHGRDHGKDDGGDAG